MKEDFNYNQQQNARAVKAGQVLSHDEPNLARVWGLPARDDEEEEPDTTGNAVMGKELGAMGRSSPEYKMAKGAAENVGGAVVGAAELASIPANVATAGIEFLSEESKPERDSLLAGPAAAFKQIVSERPDGGESEESEESEEEEGSQDRIARLNRPFGSDGVSAFDEWKSKHGGGR